MVDAGAQAPCGEALTELQDASRVTGHDDLGSGRGDPIELPLEELARDLGLHEVVYPRRPATEVGVSEVDQPEARNCPEERAGGFPNALAVCQMTGVVVRRGDVERPPRSRDV